MADGDVVDLHLPEILALVLDEAGDDALGVAGGVEKVIGLESVRDEERLAPGEIHPPELGGPEPLLAGNHEGAEHCEGAVEDHLHAALRELLHLGLG